MIVEVKFYWFIKKTNQHNRPRWLNTNQLQWEACQLNATFFTSPTEAERVIADDINVKDQAVVSRRRISMQ